jgi:hypothetical protein
LYLGTFTGNPEAHVNWKSMRENPDAFFSKDSVPDGFSWIDPSHMQKEQMGLLLDHWLGRQEEGLVGLEFTGCSRTHYRRNDYRRKTRASQDDEEDLRKGKNGQSAMLHPKRVDPVDCIDPEGPFSMLHKSAEEKIVYLRTLSMDRNYTDMIEALAKSDKVRIFNLKSLAFANVIIGFI